MKSNTDVYWNNRAKSVKNDSVVNISDLFQRNLECEQIVKYLKIDMNVLEVGCGNGYSTSLFRNLVRTISAFDYSENMITNAKSSFGETNNTFFVDNILDPKNIDYNYDLVLCVRVLINLRNLEEQKQALENITSFLKPKGLLVLVEGFSEGFENLNKLRCKLALSPIIPAKVNVYSSLRNVMPILDEHFNVENRFDLGSYDFFTRIIYPLIVGDKNVKFNSVFSEKCGELSKECTEECYSKFSRIKGFILRKK